jgi:hypothetical protein
VPTGKPAEREEQVEPQVSSIDRERDSDVEKKGASFTSVKVTVTVPVVLAPPLSVADKRRENTL